MKKLHALSATALAIVLAGCGGSPSDPVPTLPDMQGIWRSTSGAATTMSAIALPDGKVWALAGSAPGVRLLKGTFAVQNSTYAGTATSYDLSSNKVDTVNLTATVVGKIVMYGDIANTKESFNLGYQSSYDAPAALSDYAGAWKSSLGPLAATWSITTAAGNAVITGTSTTGCAYSGTVFLRTEGKAITDVKLSEVCAGVTKQFAGVGLKNATTAGTSTASLLMLLTSADEKEALALNLSK